MLLLSWNLMISKNKIKSLKTLKVEKYRIRNKKALLEGKRLIDEAINSGADIETIWFTKDALDHHSNALLIDKIKVDRKKIEQSIKNDVVTSTISDPDSILRM